MFGRKVPPTISGAGQIQSMGDLNLSVGKTKHDLLIYEGFIFVKRIQLPFAEIETLKSGFWPFEQITISSRLEPNLKVSVPIAFAKKIVKFTHGKFQISEENDKK